VDALQEQLRAFLHAFRKRLVQNLLNVYQAKDVGAAVTKSETLVISNTHFA
jgi:hypothetical protein